MDNLIPLKGRQFTTDPRLDVVKQWDHRNYLHNEREILEMFAVPQAGPRSYTWRCPTWLDQGQEGACVGFSWTHELAAWPAEVKDLNDPWAQGLYHEAQQLDEWPGENYDGTSVIGGAKAVHNRGYMESYRWATTMDDLVLAVGYHGPVVIGVDWLDSMFDPRPSGLLDTSGKVAGGHAILIRGVTLKSNLKGDGRVGPVFRLRNSWGRSWGWDGDCFIKVEDLARLFGNYIEACVPVVRNRQPHPDHAAMEAVAA
jgi:hypothetical protein